MEASQPRVKTIRATEPELTLGRQSPMPSSSEANLLELPPRLSVAEPPAPKRKAQTNKSQIKGKAARKPAMSIRQHWMNHQELLAAEMQQLESQAERINQRLAERTALSTPQPTSEVKSGPVLPTVAESKVGAPLLEDEEADQLRDQLARIHKLLAELGTTIDEGSSLVKQSEPIEVQAIASPKLTQPTDPTVQAIASPMLTQPTVQTSERDLPAASQTTIRQTRAESLAEHEAAQMAETLRQLAEKARTPSARSTPNLELSREFIQSQNRPLIQTRKGGRSRKRQRLQLADLLRLPQRPTDRVVDALIWVVLSALGRVGVRLLLVAFPVLSPLAIGLMVIPTAIGLSLLLVVPKAGYLPVYRLFLITLGLLLGGKL